MRYAELFEYSRDITAQKLGTALLQKFQKEPAGWQQRIVQPGLEPAVVLDHLLGRIEIADPTKNKQYVPWIIRAYTNNPSLKFEDLLAHVSTPLQKFFKLVNKKQIPAPNNDIGRIKDLAGLVQTVDQYPDVVDQPKNVNRGQAKPFYDDQDLRIIIPQDQAAACYYGQGTKWCTASTEAHNMFDRYNQEGEMYIVMPKKPAYNGEKYQFHFQTKQFMDEKDHRINLATLRERYPQLATIFAQQAKANHVLALDPEITDLAGMMNKAMPRFQSILASAISQQAKEKAKEIYVELGRAVRSLKGMEEIWELAEDMLDRKGIGELALAVTYIIRDNPDVADDDDALYDLLGDPITTFVREQELWLYAMEVLEELEDEEAEFDVAMTIEGELQSMMQKLVPEVFAEAIEEVKRLG